MNKPRFLLIGGWQEIVEKLARLEVNITLLHRESFADESPVARLCQQVIQVDTQDADACLEAARPLHRERPFAAVYAIRELDLLTASRVGEALGITCNPSQAVALSRDKVAMRRCLAGTTLDTVRWAAPSRVEEAREALDSIGYPAIMKPARGVGSQHIVLLREARDLDRAWSVQTQPWIIEQYLGGQEYSVEFVTLGGRHYPLGITEKQISGAPHFYETGHVFPTPLADPVCETVYCAVSTLLDCLGHRFGMSHTEIKLDGEALHILETHTRPGGDRIWKLVELATGVDAVTLTFRALLGERAVPPQTLSGRAAAVGFFHGQGDTVGRIRGLAEARAIPGVWLVSVTAREGQTLALTCSSDTRYGFVITHADSRAQAMERLDRAMATVAIDTGETGS